MRLIDADALRMELTDNMIFNIRDNLITVRYIIDKAPTIDAIAAGVQGKWYDPPYGEKWFRAPFNDVYGICNVCEQGSPFKYPYCPHCGARMERR